MSIAIDVIFSAFGLPTKTTICILKNLCNTFKIGKIALGFGHCQKNTDSFTTTSFFHTVLQGWQKRVTFLSQRSFNGSSSPGHELEKSSNNRQVDHENAQFNVEEATEGRVVLL